MSLILGTSLGLNSWISIGISFNADRLIPRTETNLETSWTRMLAEVRSIMSSILVWYLCYEQKGRSHQSSQFKSARETRHKLLNNKKNTLYYRQHISIVYSSSNDTVFRRIRVTLERYDHWERREGRETRGRDWLIIEPWSPFCRGYHQGTMVLLCKERNQSQFNKKPSKSDLSSRISGVNRSEKDIYLKNF